jgi:hypothetical protein
VVVGLELETVASGSARIYRWRGARRAQEQRTGRRAVVVMVVGERAVVEASSEACYVAALGHPRRRAARFF